MAKKFPYLEVSGTYRAIGNSIGETFRTQISRHIEKLKMEIPGYEQLREQTYPYFYLTLRWFPHYAEEITGISEGARVGVADYFFLNVPELYDSGERDDNNGCTTVLSRGADGILIGHNEDWAKDAIDELYVLKATIGKTTFLCLDYASYLSGSSVSLNSWGLVQCIDSLHSKTNIGIPSYVAARAIMECNSLDSAQLLLRSHAWASGFNHLLVQKNKALNVEMCASGMDIFNIIGDTYVHTNHFLSPDMIRYENGGSRSSHARLKKASELVTPGMNPDAMKTLLSDTSDGVFPIDKPDETIASVMTDVDKRILYVCYGRPSGGEFVPYIL